jgi:hypothetical protein
LTAAAVTLVAGTIAALAFGARPDRDTSPLRESERVLMR